MTDRSISSATSIGHASLAFYRALGLTIVAAAFLLSGCGGSDSATDVHGTITFNGQPVTYGLINFRQTGGRPLGGVIQVDGTYRYELPPGEYQVRIDTPPPPSAGVPQEASAVSGEPAAAPSSVTQTPLPPNYANFETSGLTLTVGSESSQEHNFALP